MPVGQPVLTERQSDRDNDDSYRGLQEHSAGINITAVRRQHLQVSFTSLRLNVAIVTDTIVLTWNFQNAIVRRKWINIMDLKQRSYNQTQDRPDEFLNKKMNVPLQSLLWSRLVVALFLTAFGILMPGLDAAPPPPKKKKINK